MRLLSAIVVCLTASSGFMLAQGAAPENGPRGGGLSPQEARSRFAELPPDVREAIRRRHERLREMTPEERRNHWEQFQQRRRTGRGPQMGGNFHLHAMAARKVARRVFEANPGLGERLRGMERQERRETMRGLMQDEVQATMWAIYLTPSELATLTPGQPVTKEREAELKQLVTERREKGLDDSIATLANNEARETLENLPEERRSKLLRDFGAIDLDLGANADPEALRIRRARILMGAARPPERRPGGEERERPERRGPGPRGDRPEGRGFKGGDRPDRPERRDRRPDRPSGD